MSDTYDVGAALTGALDLSPTARSALLSFGLQAMQPQAIGQTFMGHLGQAVGAAGETVTRQEQMDLQEADKAAKIQALQDRIDISRANVDRQERALELRERVGEQVRANRDRVADQRDREADRRERDLERRTRDTESRIGTRARTGDQRDTQLGINQQNADTAESRARNPRGATQLIQQRDEIRQRQEYDRAIEKEANTIFKSANDILGDRGPYATWRGKSVSEIQEALKKQKPFGYQQRYSTPIPQQNAEDDDDEDPNDTVVPEPTARPNASPPQSQVPPTNPANRAPLTTTGTIPTGAIDFLRKNPNTRGEFDALFGAGSAARILGN